MKLAQKVKGFFSRIRSSFGTAPPAIRRTSHHHHNQNPNNPYSTSSTEYKCTHHHQPARQPIRPAPDTVGAANAEAAMKAMSDRRKYRPPTAAVSSGGCSWYITNPSSLAEVVLCRHTTKTTIVTSPERPDIEFESPRSDELASYHAFVDALNRKGSGSGSGSGSNSGSSGERRRKVRAFLFRLLLCAPALIL